MLLTAASGRLYEAYTLNPQPSTLNPQPSTLNPQPSTLSATIHRSKRKGRTRRSDLKTSKLENVKESRQTDTTTKSNTFQPSAFQRLQNSSRSV